MNEYDIILNNIERLRINYGLEYNEVDDFARLKKGTYKKAIEKKIILTVIDLISIVKIYIQDVSKAFSPKMRMPAFRDLPPSIKKIAKDRLGKTEKAIKKKDFIQYCTVILSNHYKVGDEFTNSQIKGYFKGELKITFEKTSIEWNKSILSPFVGYTGKTIPGKTKPEKEYKLIKRIPAEILKKAKDTVGTDWLENK